MQSVRAKQQFRIVLIKPSHDDDDGYVTHWFRSAEPSNRLTAMYGLSQQTWGTYDTDTALSPVDDSREENLKLLQSMRLIYAPSRGCVDKFLRSHQ